MKVIWTIWRNYPTDLRENPKLVREALVGDLIDMGVPVEVAELLLGQNTFQWRGKLEGCDTFVGLDIVDSQTNALSPKQL
jgi:hypothetical protein